MSSKTGGRGFYMKIRLGWYAASMTIAFQNMTRDFDAELLLWPGGSIVATLLWLCAKASTIAGGFGMPLAAKSRSTPSAKFNAAQRCQLGNVLIPCRRYQ
jgi:hypothetical protein